MNSDQFQPFPKIPRLNREIVITEKIDGTNAQVFVWDETHNISEDKNVYAPAGLPSSEIRWLGRFGPVSIAAGSRNRWLTPDDDNYGFAAWAKAHAADLVALGHGRHYGEWWGQKIARRYHLTERRFSLFNVGRWVDSRNAAAQLAEMFDVAAVAPECCHVVPVLYRGSFCTLKIKECLEHLRSEGSWASPGFPNPEGIIVFHSAANHCFKVTLEDDEQPKGLKK